MYTIYTPVYNAHFHGRAETQEFMNLNGKTAIVTGASKGIGAGIATNLAAQGASVVVNYATSPAQAELVVKQIAENGGKAIAIQADVTQSDDVERLLGEATRAFGPLDILVNNAGIFEFGPIESISEERFVHLYATNVWGPIQVIQKSLAHFNESGGSIVNIGSGVTRMLSPGASLYAGTKGAVELISIVLSKELGPWKIRVNVVSPGATETEGAHAVGAMSDAGQQRYAASTPLGRVGKPDDIARLVTFLASDESAWITGEIIHASGGLR